MVHMATDTENFQVLSFLASVSEVFLSFSLVDAILLCYLFCLV